MTADIPTLRSLYRIWEEDGHAEDAASLARSVPSLLDEANIAQAEAARLREAIERHRRDITAHGEQVGEDEALWAVLDDEPSELEERFWKRVSEVARQRAAGYVPCPSCREARHDDCESVLPDGRVCTCWTCFRWWTD